VLATALSAATAASRIASSNVIAHLQYLNSLEMLTRLIHPTDAHC
jgi:hypothetical protein